MSTAPIAAGSTAAFQSSAIEPDSSASHAIAVMRAIRLAESVRRRMTGESATLSRSGAYVHRYALTPKVSIAARKWAKRQRARAVTGELERCA